MKITISNKEISKLVSKLSYPKELLETIGSGLEASTKQRIQTTKTSPDGKLFAPWRPGTLKARIKKGTASRGLLFDSGNLYNSITHQLRQNSVEVGVTDKAPYAILLQQGTSKMVARPFVGISQKDRLMISNAIKTFFKTV